MSTSQALGDALRSRSITLKAGESPPPAQPTKQDTLEAAVRDFADNAAGKSSVADLIATYDPGALAQAALAMLAEVTRATRLLGMSNVDDLLDPAIVSKAGRPPAPQSSADRLAGRFNDAFAQKEA